MKDEDAGNMGKSSDNSEPSSGEQTQINAYGSDARVVKGDWVEQQKINQQRVDTQHIATMIVSQQQSPTAAHKSLTSRRRNSLVVRVLISVALFLMLLWERQMPVGDLFPTLELTMRSWVRWMVISGFVLAWLTHFWRHGLRI